MEIITATALEPGWTGKLWALQNGVRRVGQAGVLPDFWLFTDADVRHDEGNLCELVHWAQSNHLDMASLMVRLHCDARNGWERTLIPAFVYFFMQLYPFSWSRSPGRRTAAAAGGCVLLSNQALEQIGGLAAICDRIIDDCSLANAVKSSGGRIDLRLTDRAQSIRPYGSLEVVWDMVKRSAFTQLRESNLLVAATVFGMLLLYAVPPAALVAGAARRRPRLFGFGALAWGLMTATYLPTIKMYGLAPRNALALPVAALLYTAMTVDSAIAHARRRGGTWKGRTYGV